MHRLDAGYPVDFQVRTSHHPIRCPALTVDQDLVSRFTIDSTTELLSGSDIRTLSAGLPYPSSFPLANTDAFVNHPSNKLAHAFVTGQYLTALRIQRGSSWPLAEFWKDKVKPHRKIVDQFIEPILAEALARRVAIGSNSDKKEEKDEDEDEETFLNQLINHIQGFQFTLFVSLKLIFFHQTVKY